MLRLTRPDGTRPEDLHLSRRAATALFFSGYAAAALGATARPIHTPADGLAIESVLIPNGDDGPLPTYVARPLSAGPHPVILVVNEVFGIHDYIKDVCRRLARLGYVALAPAFFYRSGVDLPAQTDMQAIMAVVKATPDAQVDSDVRAALGWIARRRFAAADKVGITGFCWGGAVVWRAAMGDPDVRAGVAFYGQLKDVIGRAAELHAPVLGLYGGKDQGIPQTDIAAMRTAVAAAHKSAEIVFYPTAGHGFHADYRDSYDPAAATDGWKRMLAFFRANGVA